MTRNGVKFNTWISPENLEIINKFCKENGYYRSTYMKEVSLICVKYGLSPEKLEKLLQQQEEKEYK